MAERDHRPGDSLSTAHKEYKLIKAIRVIGVALFAFLIWVKFSHTGEPWLFFSVLLFYVLLCAIDLAVRIRIRKRRRMLLNQLQEAVDEIR